MLLIRGGRVIDPANGVDEVIDLLVKGDRIFKLGKNLKAEEETLQIIEAQGKIVTPGFIDMHTHLREPGGEDEETIASGSRAAARGGFTSVVCMANTQPVNDNQSVTHYILSQAAKEGIVNVFPVGSISKGLKGEELSEIGELKEAGCAALSDDGKPVMNGELMRRALEYAQGFGLKIISHCEDLNLSAGGVMNEGVVSTQLGLRGIPAAAEEVMVARDLILAELTRSPLHLAHISTVGSVALIREAKKKGIRVTAEVTPHHLILKDEVVESFDTNTKVNPPLRSEKDILALKEGVKDGTIEVIASDHAPHNLVEKDQEYDYAPFGVVGLETAVALILTELVGKGVISLGQAIKNLSLNPARILGLDKGTLTPGAEADITILNLEREGVVKAEDFQSKGKNSPFIGWKLKGMPVVTIVKGKIVWENK